MKVSLNVLWRITALSMIAMLLLGACASGNTGGQTTPQVIRETVVVTQAGAGAQSTTPQVVRETVVVTQEAQAQPTAAAGGQMDANAPKLNADVSGNVELWHFWASPVRRNAIRRIIAMCQAELPNIKVTDTVKPFGDIWTANLAAVAAGSGMPDVIVSDRPTLPKDAADGVYMNLQEWAARDNVTRDQFYDWAWDQTLFENGVYGVPFETDVRVLFWNKQAFTEAGLDPEKPPTTWAEVEQYADKLDKKNPDGSYARMGFFPLWNASLNPFWAYLNGAPMVAEDGTPKINDPKAVEALTWMKKWVDRYGGWQNIQNFKAGFGAPPNDVFMGGGVAMLVDIYGYNSQLEFYRPQVKMPDDKTVRMDWGIGMLPHNEGAQPADWSGGFSLSIPTGAKNAEAAWEFIKCATGKEGQASWARDTQAQPTNLAAASDPVLLASPGWNVVEQALKVSTGGAYVSKYPNWNEQLDQRYERVWLGELTPQQALDETQKAVEDAIK